MINRRSATSLLVGASLLLITGRPVSVESTATVARHDAWLQEHAGSNDGANYDRRQ